MTFFVMESFANVDGRGFQGQGFGTSVDAANACAGYDRVVTF